MTAEPYLIQLATRLSFGLREWDEERCIRHARFIQAQQQEDGGFKGRDGDSDLYYTSFALRGLTLVSQLTPEIAERTIPFLQEHQPLRLNVVDLISWLNSALMLQVTTGVDLTSAFSADLVPQLMDRLESFRREDGGYAKSDQGAAGSTYQSFLTALCYQFLGQSVPRPNALIQFLYDRQREDGGFVEIAPMKRSGTNPTAAAVVMLNILDAWDQELEEDLLHFLKEVRSDEGGFQANTRIPFADGLSTFTGLLTLQDLNIPANRLLKADRIRNLFETQLEFPTGGFRGAHWDDQADVEYTFYGLGTLALLNAEES
ncbi:Prenyltransferase and squalene oxidase repeat protein [Polystyrenella longa]|uniref:Geranylgeranyl transferase type II subunit beta n=2 Tax=Polystyrenella longa TaxID=2528007 RepID=A0A518CGS9_9PLAN|nr:Prenyltransferase and squalene oxidase repeat protein [Polystyrenella longa]